jgi:hypothetical protein
MIRKVIYLIESPFNKRDFNRFGIKTLIQDGFDVSVWDFTAFLHPALNRLAIPPDRVKFNKLNQFASKKKAIEALSKLEENVFIISILSYNYSTIGIFKTISKKNISYSILGYFFSILEIEGRKANDVLKKILRVTPKKIVRHLTNLPMKLPYSFYGIKPATFGFMGGKITSVIVPLVGSKTKIVYIHSFDYDLYLNEKNDDHFDSESIVFLDQNIPFNTDPISSGVKRLTTSDEYYHSLCKFFDYVEAQTGIEVIIAAHPRSHYEDKGYLFQDRQIKRGNTSRLVKNSKFVITHYTTAINFAVLYKKPIIFITTNAIEKSFRQRAIDTLANYFGQRVINIDRKIDVDLEGEAVIKKEIYNNFLNDFIKVKGTPDVPFWEVVSSHIQSLNI